MTIIIFFLMLAVLILAHEAGHFAMAKLFRVTVKEFGLGFPPRIFGFTRGGTTYSVNWVLLGGFVKMVGEEDPSEPGSLASKPIPQRIAVMSAGSIVNILLPVFLVSASLMVPHQVAQEKVLVQQVAVGSPAERAGIQPGDQILKIDGNDVTNRGDVGYRIALRLGADVNMLLQGPDGSERQVSARARWSPPQGQGAVGIMIEGKDTSITTQSRPIWVAVPQGARTAWETMVLFRNEIAGWFIRKTAPQVTGPVGIAQVTGEIAREGLSPLLRFAALLSINLGIFNLLPLPALDGGRLAFVLLEAVRRGKRISPRKEGLVHLIGFAIILGAMVFITYWDIMRMIRGEGPVP